MKIAPLIGAQHAAHVALHESAAGLTLLGVGEAPLCGTAMKRSGPAPELPCDQGEGGAGEALSEAAGEALSEASRVGALESTPPSSARRIGIVQDGVESMPPSEYRKPPSNAWTSPSEHRESTFLRLPAHPSAYSHILPSQAESSNRGGELLSLSRYPFPIPTAYFQHSAQLHELLVNRRGMICALCGTSMKTLMALHCKGWKKNTDTKGLTRRSKERSSRRSMTRCLNQLPDAAALAAPGGSDARSVGRCSAQVLGGTERNGERRDKAFDNRSIKLYGTRITRVVAGCHALGQRAT